MAKRFKTGVIIEGDASGGVRAVRATESELKKLDRQERQNTQSNQRLARSFKSLRANAAGIAAGAGVAAAGLATLAARQAEQVNETAQMARTLGTTTGELQSFGYAARQVGIESDKAGDVLKDLSDKIGDASLTGGGEVAPALEKIGLSAEKLQQESPVQALVDIGAAIEGLPRAQQVNVLESIADDGARLLPLLKDGGRALRSYSQEARDFGVSLNSIQVDQLVAASRATQQLRGLFEGLENQLALAVAPALQGMAKDSQQLAATFQSREFQQGVQFIATTAAELAKAMAGAVSQLSRLQQLADHFSWGDLGKLIFDKSGPGFLAHSLGYDPFGGDESKSATPAPAGPPSHATVTGGQSTLPRPIARQTSNTIAVRPKTDPFADQAELVRAAGDAWQQALTKQHDATQRVLADLMTPEERARQAMQQRADTIRNSTLSESRQLQLLQKNWDQYAATVDDSTSQASAFAHRAAENIQDELGDTLQQTLSGNFDGIGDAWARTLQQMATQAASQNLAGMLFGQGFGQQGGKMGGLFGTIASGIGGLFGGGLFGGGASAANATSLADAGIGSTGATSGLTSAAGSLFGGLFADGGRPPRNKASIVGERGPEVFVPDTAGTIVPNERMAMPRMSAQPTSGDVHVEVVNNGQPVQVERQSQRTNADGSRHIKMIVKNAVEDMSRTGEFDKIMSQYGARRQGKLG